jgi:hypothetical protein
MLHLKQGHLKKDDLKKQSQFTPARTGATSCVLRAYENTPRGGLRKSRAKQSQFHLFSGFSCWLRCQQRLGGFASLCVLKTCVFCAAVLKLVVPKGAGSSNPSCSVESGHETNQRDEKKSRNVRIFPRLYLNKFKCYCIFAV